MRDLRNHEKVFEGGESVKERRGSVILMQKCDSYVIIRNFPTRSCARSSGIYGDYLGVLEPRLFSKCAEGCPRVYRNTRIFRRGSCHRQDRARFKDPGRQRDSRCTGACCHGTLTCKRVARALAHAGDKSKV